MPSFRPYRPPTVPMDSPFYAPPKMFVRDHYARGDYGPPADGVEYRVTYSPKSGEYVRLGTNQPISGFAQPQAPMLSQSASMSTPSLVTMLGPIAVGGLLWGKKGVFGGAALSLGVLLLSRT